MKKRSFFKKIPKVSITLLSLLSTSFNSDLEENILSEEPSDEYVIPYNSHQTQSESSIIIAKRYIPGGQNKELMRALPPPLRYREFLRPFDRYLVILQTEKGKTVIIDSKDLYQKIDFYTPITLEF